MIGLSISPAYAGGGTPTCSIHIAGGVDAGSFSCSYNDGTDTFEIDETWTGTDDFYIIFDDLEFRFDYKVNKIIRNSIDTPGLDLTRITEFSNELLDPEGDKNDADFDGPCPGTICPAGFTRSNDPDKLSFTQGSPPAVPRDSDAFFMLFPDEFGTIDFLDFALAGNGHPGQICNDSADDDASCTDPTFDTQDFGIRDSETFGSNQAFLLRESLTLSKPPMIGGEMVSSDFAVLAIAGMKDNAFNILGILSLVGVSTFAALYFTVKRK